MMDFQKLAMSIAVALVVLIFFIYESEEGTSNSSGSRVDGSDSEIPSFANQKKVNLSVYYESLSQSCATFITKDLQEMFHNDLINIIVNLQLVPWANAFVNRTNNNSIACQNKNYAVISCFEFAAFDATQKKWPDCFEKLGLPKETILNCFNTGHGTELGQKYINEIAQLYPRPTNLPWVVVNNQPIGQDYEKFTYYVCKAYRGVDVPAVCNRRFK